MRNKQFKNRETNDRRAKKKQTSTVGFPRLSKICLALTTVIVAIVRLDLKRETTVMISKRSCKVAEERSSKLLIYRAEILSSSFIYNGNWKREAVRFRL